MDAGRAQAVGETIRKTHRMEPAGIFFENVARVDPNDPESPLEGQGRFEAEIWVLSWFGIDFTGFTKAQLVATRFFFDALFPFLLLFTVSFLTHPVPKAHLDRFFARLHTPVQNTPEAEQKALADAYAHPDQYKKHKLFPGSQWEIMKPGWIDVLGFGGSWILVGVIILLLWLMVSMG